MMCRYNTGNKGIKANNHEFDARKFDCKILDDVLHWYTKVQDLIKQKHFEDV